MRIVAEHLTHIYNLGSPFAVKALDDVTLTVEEGEFFGILGHTGSGKSTFVQHLNGLIRLPSSQKRRGLKKGEMPSVLRVGEFDLADKKTDFRALRKNVGMVFQYPEYQLFAETVFDDVAFGIRNFAEKGEKFTDAALKDRAAEALSIVGLGSEFLSRSPFELSGGQKRRAAVAGVIVTKPEILILDEPAAGLDPLGKREIMDLLHRIHGDWCKTVIVVSHDMDEVSENCTRAVVFSEGRAAFSGTPKEIFARADELFAMGLDLPLTAKLERALRVRGIEIASDLTLGDFLSKVLQKGGKA